jgi:hypothetical protein
MKLAFLVSILCIAAGFCGCSKKQEKSEMSVSDARAACIQNQRNIKGAKQQWALEHLKTASDAPLEAELFGAGKYMKEKPACPSGGTYTINPVGQNVICSIADHNVR